MSKADLPVLLTGLLGQEEGEKGAGEGHVYFLTSQATIMTIKEYVGKEVRGPIQKGGPSSLPRPSQRKAQGPQCNVASDLSAQGPFLPTTPMDYSFTCYQAPNDSDLV